MPDAFGNRNVGEILAAGGANSVAFLLNIGRSPGEIFAHLRRTFGDATDRTLQAVLDRTARSQLAGLRFATLPFDRVVPLRDIPLSPNLQSQEPGAGQPRVQFTVQVGFRSAISRDLQYTTIVIDSAQNLTRGELREEIMQAWQRIRQGERGSDRIRGLNLGMPVQIEVTQVWRTS